MAVLLEKAYLLFPLLAAVLYSIGALALKTSSDDGVDNRRASFLCNALMTLMFLVFYDWFSFPRLPEPWWPVCALAVLFLLGQLFTVMAIGLGEVSCVTPVLGVKVILVGVLAACVAGLPVSAGTWAGGVLSTIGIVLLQVNDRPFSWHGSLKSLLCAFLAAFSFAAFDTMTQYWSPRIGFGALVPPAMVVTTALSALMLIGHRGRWPSWRRAGFRYLLAGAVLFGVQSVVMIRAIGVFGDAAGANVVYSSRGLWGLFFLWLLGHWFRNRELTGRHPKVVIARIAGAALIAAAILLLFV